MWTAFPSSEYYGGSVPSRSQQQTVCLPAATLAARSDGRSRDGSHVHHVPIDGGSAQLFPGSLATSTPQTFLMAPSGGMHNLRKVRRVVNGLGAHYCPAHIRRVGAGFTLAGVPPLVHFRCAFPSSLPGARRTAVPTRPVVVRAACHPSRHLPAQAALSFTSLLRQRGGGGLPLPLGTHGASWRTVTT